MLLHFLFSNTLHTGPTAPVFTDFNVTNVQHNVSTIQWTVPVIAYTPESYVVNYGTDMNMLNSMSETLYSGENFTAENLMFSVELTDLQFCTVYYYQLVANNSKETTEMMNSFQTRKYIEM